jgi:hypothetical protein
MLSIPLGKNMLGIPLSVRKHDCFLHALACRRLGKNMLGIFSLLSKMSVDSLYPGKCKGLNPCVDLLVTAIDIKEYISVEFTVAL